MYICIILKQKDMLTTTNSIPNSALFQQIVELESKLSELKFQLEMAQLKLEHEEYMRKEYERMFNELKQRTIKNL